MTPKYSAPGIRCVGRGGRRVRDEPLGGRGVDEVGYQVCAVEDDAHYCSRCEQALHARKRLAERVQPLVLHTVHGDADGDVLAVARGGELDARALLHVIGRGHDDGAGDERRVVRQ